MQPRYRRGAGVRQFLAAIGEQPQRHQLILARDWPQGRSAGRDHRDGMRVSGVRLAALPGGEHPGSRRQLRGHIHHRLAVGDQPLRDMAPDALAAFDCPGPLRPGPPRREHRPVAGAVSPEPARPQDLFPIAKNLDRRRHLVRIHTDDDPAHATLLAPSNPATRARRATLLRAEQAPLEPLPATAPGEDACHVRATPRSVGSRKESVPPGTSANPARPAVSPSEQEAQKRVPASASLTHLPIFMPR